MPFSRPTFQQLVERVIADIEARVEGADARLRRSVFHVLARVHGEATHGLYGFLDWISRQPFADTADAENMTRLADVWGVGRKAAAVAEADVLFTGASGIVIPELAVLVRSDGREYETAASGTIASGTVTLPIRARLAGALGSLSAGAKLTLASPIGGVDAQATVAAGPSDGSDEEDDESLRARLLLRIQAPPHGGAYHDYLAWALEVPGVTRAFVFPLQFGLGTVGVTFLRDGDGTGPAALPDLAEVAAVQAHIDAVRPVTAAVTVYTCTAALDAFTIHVSPDTPEIRSAVSAELDDLYLREARPGGTILVSRIREAVSRAAGESDNVVSVPSANVTHTATQMPMRGTITWA